MKANKIFGKYFIGMFFLSILLIIQGCGISGNQGNQTGSQANTGTQNSDLDPQIYSTLTGIYEKAKIGAISGVEFKSKTNIIEDVQDKWGKAEKEDWTGKGRYFTYSGGKIVFGVNKGDQIYDVRSYEDYLKGIKYFDIEQALGTPKILELFSGENIITYNLNDDYQLRFIFPEPTQAIPNPFLNHISVFSPKDAKNLMAE